MKNNIKIIFAAITLMLLAFSFQSCEEPYDYTMNLPPDEQAEAMIGTWVLTRAGTVPPALDENGEEHIPDNMETSLQYIEITSSDITFHFREPVPVYFLGEATQYEPQLHDKSASLTFKHSVGGIPNLTAINTGSEENPSFAFCYSENDPCGANEFVFYTKDDIHAIRTILNFFIEGFYLEFEREN